MNLQTVINWNLGNNVPEKDYTLYLIIIDDGSFTICPTTYHQGLLYYRNTNNPVKHKILAWADWPIPPKGIEYLNPVKEVVVKWYSVNLLPEQSGWYFVETPTGLISKVWYSTDRKQWGTAITVVYWCKDIHT